MAYNFDPSASFQRKYFNFNPVADFERQNFKLNTSSGRISSERKKLIEELSQKVSSFKYNVENDRSTLSKVFDFLSLPLYTTAGFVKGMVDDGTAHSVNPFEGAWKGFKSGFTGEEEGRYTYSKVMQASGWNPTSTAGKIGQGVLGFGLDVLLDPLTYLSGGTSALVRGTGRAGVATTHTKPFIKSVVEGYDLQHLKDIDDIAPVDLAHEVYQKVLTEYSGRGSGYAEKLAKSKADEVYNTLSSFKGGMDVDTAKKIITAREAGRGITLTDAELLYDAEKFASKFNQTIGLREVPEHGLNLSLKNLPFIGEKYFPRARRLEFTTPKGTQAFGEAMIAPHYAKLRNAIYGTRFAEKLSGVTPLYRASKEDPGIVYDFVKRADIVMGATKDKIAQERAIKRWAETRLKNLTPAESKQLLDVLEDKSLWADLRRTVRLLDSKEAKMMRNEVARKHDEYSKNLDDLIDTQKTLKNTRYGIDNDIISENEKLDLLRKEYEDRLAKLSFDETTGYDNLMKLSSLYEDEAQSIHRNMVDNIIKHHRSYTNARQSGFKPTSKGSMDVVVDDLKYVKGVGYVKKTEAEKLKDIGNQLNVKGSESVGQLEAKVNLADALSEYIYGTKGRVHRNLFPNKYDELVKLVEKGYTPDELWEHLTDNPYGYVNREEMFAFIGKKIGYGKDNKHGFKNWNDFYTKRLDELYKKYDIKKDVGELNVEDFASHAELVSKRFDSIRMSDRDAEFLAELTSADYERRTLLAMFNKTGSYDEVLEYIKQDEFKNGAAGMHLEEAAQIDDLARRQDAIEQTGSILRNKVSGIDESIAKHEQEIETIKTTKLEKTTTNIVERKLSKKDISGFKSKLKSIEKSLAEHQKMFDSKEFGTLLNEKMVKKIIDGLNAQRKECIQSLVSGVKKVKRVVKSESKKSRIERLTQNIEKLKIEKEQLLKDKLLAETPVGGFLPHERQSILDTIYNNSKYKNAGTRAYAEEVIADMETFLQELGKNWSDISLAQKNAIRKLSKWNVERAKGKKPLPRISWADMDESKFEATQKEAGKLYDIIYGTKKSRLADVPDVQLTHQTIRLKELEGNLIDLDKKIFEYQKLKGEVDSKRLRDIEQLKKEVNTRADVLVKNVRDLEDSRKNLFDSIRTNNANIHGTGKRIEHLNKLLNDDDVFETYVRTNLSADEIDEATTFIDVTKVMLDGDTTIDNKIKLLAKELNRRFTEIGASEVKAGVLKQEQVDRWINGYVTRVLTEDGIKFLNLQKFDDNIKSAITQDYGYGKIRNPYSMSRVKNFDGYNINQINKEMSKKLKGKNLFSDCIFDIYQTRALQNLEILYDRKYTEGMMNIFGNEVKRGSVIKEGYGSVISYAKIKDSASDMAKLHVSMQVSDVISEHVKQFMIKNSATLKTTIDSQLIAQGVKGKDYYYQYNRMFNEAISNEIEAFTAKAFTDEKMRDLFNSNFDSFLNGSTLGKGSIGDMATPMAELDRDSVEAIFKYYDRTISSFQDKIRDRVFKFEKGKLQTKIDYFENLAKRQRLDSDQYSYLNRAKAEFKLKYVDDVDEYGEIIYGTAKRIAELKSASMNDIRGVVNKLKSGAYDFETSRLDGLLGSIEKLDKLEAPQIREVHQTLINKANQSRKLQMLKDHNRLLAMYDKFLHFVKLNQTVIMPAFHMRNKFSNMFNSWLGVGQDALKPATQIDAFKTVRGQGDKYGKMIDELGMTWDEVYDLARAHGVIDEGYFAKDVGAHSQTQGLFRKWIKGKYDITDTKNFFAYKVGTDVGGTIENTDRLVHFVSRLKSGDKPWKAAESVEKYLFDYSNITAFEANVMKRIFPYYVWMRKNGALQVEQLLEKPFKYALVAKATHAIENSNDEKTKMNPAYVDRFAQDWIQLPFTVKNPKGVTERVMLNPNMPYMDLSRIPKITSPIKSIEDLISQMAPMIKAPIELGLNRNMKFEQPIFKPSTEEHPTTTAGSAANYLFSNFAGYNVGKDMVNKTGLDLGLQMLNNVSGVKLLSYDYETYKSMKMKSKIANGYLTSEEMDKKFRSFFTDVGGSLVSGFKGHMSRAVDSALADRPDAFNYEGALRPISKKSYDSLSDEDKMQYVPPTLDEAIVYKKQAKELEQQQLKDSGTFKRFTWALFDKLDTGDKPTIGNVTRVIDGDTFEVDINGKKEKVRLLLVDTPESVGGNALRDYNEKPMPFGKEASEFGKKTLFGKDVKLIFDGPKEDATDSKRMLAYVSVDGEDYNERLLGEGLAQVRYLFEPNYKNKSKYYKTEEEAYKRKKGLWSREGYAIPGDDTGYFEFRGR